MQVLCILVKFFGPALRITFVLFFLGFFAKDHHNHFIVFIVVKKRENGKMDNNINSIKLLEGREIQFPCEPGKKTNFSKSASEYTHYIQHFRSLLTHFFLAGTPGRLRPISCTKSQYEGIAGETSFVKVTKQGILSTSQTLEISPGSKTTTQVTIGRWFKVLPRLYLFAGDSHPPPRADARKNSRCSPNPSINTDDLFAALGAADFSTDPQTPHLPHLLDLLDVAIVQRGGRPLVVHCRPDPRSLSRAANLLELHMVLRAGLPPDWAAARLHPIGSFLTASWDCGSFAGGLHRPGSGSFPTAATTRPSRPAAVSREGRPAHGPGQRPSGAASVASISGGPGSAAPGDRRHPTPAPSSGAAPAALRRCASMAALSTTPLLPPLPSPPPPPAKQPTL